MNLTLLILAGAIASGAPSSAVEADLSAVESRVEALSDQAQRLEQAGNVTYLTHDEAVIRFQDNLFLELVGDHGPAAEGFYALVTTHALDDDLGLARDADWYLAESLAGLGNTKTAAARFQIIVDNPSHPYHDDAVRRLLELYAQTGDRDAFKALYDAEIATGRVTPTPLITYSLAKSFYQQGDFVNARLTFNQVASDTAWYGRSRYFLGVMNVVDGHLDDAAAQFQAVANLPVQSTEDRLVHDQALLALGRLSYDRGQYLPAAEFYALIAEDSPYQADKLYEVVWTSIRAQRWQDALNNVEVFLLAFPDHAYAAQLDLLQGHLNFQQQNWDEAQTSYEQVITDYTPVRDRFAMLAQPGTESDAAVREVLESTGGIEDIPPYALAMMREDPDLSRAMDVFSDLERQRQDIEVSERLITELSSIVNAGEAGTVERVRADALAARLDVVGAKLALIAVEADLGLGPNDSQDRLAERRVALEDRSHKVTIEMLTSTHEVEALWSESGVLAGELRALRPGRESDEALARLDAAHQSLDETWRRLGKPIEGIQLTNDQALLVQLRAQFDQEVADVGVERSDYEATIGDARSVALNLTRDGFGRLEDFFADSVLKADMGIVDVFWSEKLEVSDELTRVREEKDAALADLERRFQLIHDKMGESR